KAMTADDIAAVTDQFAHAARRARDAGFDGIEIHGAHGYLLSGFLSRQWNQRDDGYGGSVENRSRFLCEVLRASRDAIGDEIPIWCRLDAREYRTPDGIRFADTTVTARLAQEAGAAAIHLSAYGDSTSASAFTEGTLPHVEAKHAAESAALKAVLEVPVIGVGRVRPETGERMIAEGKADLIAMGRQMLADPETAGKLIEGRPEDIRPCINCYVCVASPFFDRRVHCAVNPALGHESELADATRTAAADPKRVVVVGGGPAGMEAARVAASRGHRVTLFEASPHLGGALRFAALVYQPNRRLLAWLIHQMTALGVDVRTGTPASPAEIAALRPDAVIVAIGGARHRSQIPGAELGHVVDGDDLRKVLTGSGDGDARKIPLIGRLAARAGRLLGLTEDPGRLAELTRYYMPVGKRVVVIGGGLVGIEIAEFLVDRKRSVTVLHEGPTMAPEMAHPRRWRVLADLRDHGTTLITGATATRITATEVHYRLADDTEASADADSVVIATGLTGNQNLDQWRHVDGVEPIMIGDATGITYLEGAMHDGHRAALALG
ncbi:MAG: FAD-dependent oxidoreductase, partial [Acidimicrobiales bacterium]